MDDERSDGGGEAEVEDEFACAGMLRGSLTSLHSTVERIFCVKFAIAADDMPHGNNGQIWLKLRGSSGNVKAAKVRHISSEPVLTVMEPLNNNTTINNTTTYPSLLNPTIYLLSCALFVCI